MVMNAREEIQIALQEFQEGTFIKYKGRMQQQGGAS